MMVATVRHHLPVLEELVRAGTNVNLQDKVITRHTYTHEIPSRTKYAYVLLVHTWLMQGGQLREMAPVKDLPLHTQMQCMGTCKSTKLLHIAAFLCSSAGLCPNMHRLGCVPSWQHSVDSSSYAVSGSIKALAKFLSVTRTHVMHTFLHSMQYFQV